MRDLCARLDQGPFEVVGVDDPEWRTAWTIPVGGGAGAGAGADAGAAGAQGSIAPPVGTLRSRRPGCSRCTSWARATSAS